MFLSVLKCFTSLPKTNLGFSIYQMGTMHSMKEVLMAEERNVIKFYELQFLNGRGRCIKEKGTRQHQDLFLLFYTFKDCTAYVTYPHCTAAKMTRGLNTAGCVHFNIHNIHTQKKNLCNLWSCFSHFWICLTNKFLYPQILQK